MNSQEVALEIQKIIDKAKEEQELIMATTLEISRKIAHIHAPNCICLFCAEEKDTNAKKTFPNENIVIVPESSIGKDWERFTIRGKCLSSFFVATVKQFYSFYSQEIGEKDASATQTVSGEWTTLFQGKQGFFAALFGSESTFVLAQVPFMYRIAETSVDYGRFSVSII